MTDLDTALRAQLKQTLSHTPFTRIRGETLKHRDREYVRAARALGGRVCIYYPP